MGGMATRATELQSLWRHSSFNLFPFACDLETALVVGRPPTIERGGVARMVFGTGTHELRI